MKFQDFIKEFPDREEEVTERAAIIEYSAGISRQEAERVAVEIQVNKLNIDNKVRRG